MTGYETLRQRHVADAMATIPEHLERLTWPPERLGTERERRLRALLRIAKERSSWHRDRLRDVDADAVREEDLPHLPAMTKDDLMDDFDAIVTDPRLTLDVVNGHIDGLTTDAYLLDRYHAVASGGSSGRRGVFVYDWEAWAAVWAGFLRCTMRDWMSDPELSGVPPVLAAVAAGHASHMTSALAYTFATGPSHRFPVTLPMPEIVAGLNDAQPTTLFAYASVLPELAAEARACRLRIAPRRVVSTSEPLLPEIRAAVEETWGAPVANWWGTSEAGPTGVGCFAGPGMHLAEDLMIVEPVDEHGRPLPPGTRSAKVYLTNLFNPTVPLIRYELTDEVTVLDEPCPCGSTHRRVDDVGGRLDDWFVYARDVKVHPHAFRSSLGRHAGVVEYQVRQTPEGAEVLVRGTVEAAGLAREIGDELTRLGLDAPKVDVTCVDRIERQPTGKLKRFIPLASTTAAL